MEAAMRCFIIVLSVLFAINVQKIGFAFGKVLREIHQVRPGVGAFNQSEQVSGKADNLVQKGKC